MSTGHCAYLDTSALAKWYLNESGSDAFVGYLQSLNVAVISSLSVTEMRSLLSRRRRMGELTVEGLINSCWFRFTSMTVFHEECHGAHCEMKAMKNKAIEKQIPLVPTLLRRNAYRDAPASHSV